MDLSQIVDQLLTNRGLTTDSQKQEFLSPPPPATYPYLSDPAPVASTIIRHLQDSKIVIVGDYDVDGVCSTAILWESLSSISSQVTPFIPNRRLHGYGLNDQTVSEVLQHRPNLVITLDCGITATDQITRLNQSGVEVCVIDHHEISLTDLPHVPQMHSTQSCASVLTWQLVSYLQNHYGLKSIPDHLGLAALAVVCDIIPLLGINRSLVKYGLAALGTTPRPGLQSLFQLTKLASSAKTANLSTYDCGFIIGPRLNAMGRLSDAMDSLRLICTTNASRGQRLAKLLDSTNQTRQIKTESALKHAMEKLDPASLPDILTVADSSYDEGVIGLIAAKLVEKFHRPAIAFSVGPDQLKGSARSIPGVHVTNLLRQFQPLFKSLGGHAMAAGMSLSPDSYQEFSQAISSVQIDPKFKVRTPRFDLQLSPEEITNELCEILSQFEPFGFGNPTPQFLTTANGINHTQIIGSTGRHLKINHWSVPAVWFDYDPQVDLRKNHQIIYQIHQKVWRDRPQLQLLIRAVNPIVEYN